MPFEPASEPGNGSPGNGGGAGLPASSRDLVALLLLFSVLLVLVAPGYHELMLDRDAGSQLSKGQQILFGHHPYVDVDSSVYGPAIFYLSALGQLVAGGRLLPEILVIFAGYLVTYLLLFRVFRSSTDRRALFLVFALLAILAFPRFHKYHVLLPQAIMLFGLHRALLVNDPAKSGFRLGVACVLAGLFRVDTGAYGLLAALLLLLLRYGPSGSRAAGKALAVLLGTGLAILAPWLVFLGVSGDLREIVATFYDTATGVMTGLQKPAPSYHFGSSPLGGDNALFLVYWFFRLAPAVVLIVTVVRMLRRKRAVREPAIPAPGRDYGRVYLLAASAFALLVYLQASHRVDLRHVKQSMVAGLFVTFLAVARWWPSGPARARAARAVSAGALVVLAGFLGAVLANEKLAERGTYSLARLRDTVASWTVTRETALGAVRGKGSLPDVLRRVRQLTGPEDAVLFLAYRPQAYFFAGRHFGTPHGWVYPGRFLAEGSQQRFIRGMATTELVVDAPAFTFDRRPSGNARVHAPEVMRHAYSAYGPFEIIGEYILLSRRPRVWRERGRFDFELRAHGNGILVDAAGKTRAGASPGLKIGQVNTLRVPAAGEAYTMPHGAGLLLTAEPGDGSAPGSPECAFVGLLAGRDLFVVARKGRPVPMERLRQYHLIDTGGAPPGTHRLVRWPCASPEGESLEVEATGISITLRPVERADAASGKGEAQPGGSAFV